MSKKLPVIGQSVSAGRYHMPANHTPVVVVPLFRGARCSTCKWVTPDLKRCVQPDYIKFMGTELLPGPAHRICSDWWEAK